MLRRVATSLHGGGLPMHCLDVLGRIDFRDAEGAELRAVLAQPKRFALLVFVALESAHTARCAAVEVLDAMERGDDAEANWDEVIRLQRVNAARNDIDQAEGWT